jgi:hypothetical protein
MPNSGLIGHVRDIIETSRRNRASSRDGQVHQGEPTISCGCDEFDDFPPLEGRPCREDASVVGDGRREPIVEAEVRAALMDDAALIGHVSFVRIVSGIHGPSSSR